MILSEEDVEIVKEKIRKEKKEKGSYSFHDIKRKLVDEGELSLEKFMQAYGKIQIEAIKEH